MSSVSKRVLGELRAANHEIVRLRAAVGATDERLATVYTLGYDKGFLAGSAQVPEVAIPSPVPGVITRAEIDQAYGRPARKGGSL